MLIYSTNFADKLFGYAISRDFIKNSSPFCDLIDDPILGPEIDLAINFNRGINGDKEAATNFTNTLALCSGIFDPYTVKFWTKKMYNYPVFDPEIERLKFIYYNLDELTTIGGGGSDASRDFASLLKNALKDCLNSPCNLFSPTSNSVGLITQVAPALTESTILPVGSLKGQMSNITSGMDTTIMNKVPEIFQGAFVRLSQATTAAWGDVCNTVMGKKTAEELAQQATSGTLRDKPSGHLFTPDINAFASLSFSSTNIMASIMGDLGGCSRKMEHESQYNPYSSNQNKSTPADIRGNNVNGNAYDQLPNGQTTGNPLPMGVDQALGVAGASNDIEVKPWDGNTALTNEVTLEFSPDAPYSYTVFGAWLDEKAKTVHVEDINLEQKTTGSEQIAGIANIGEVITPIKSGITEAVLLQDALEKKKLPANFTKGYASLYAQGNKTNENLNKITGSMNHGVSLGLTVINKLLGVGNQSIEYSKIKALQQQNKVWGVITINNKTTLVQMIDCSESDKMSRVKFTPYAWKKVTGKDFASPSTTTYGAWKETKYKSHTNAGPMKFRFAIGTEGEIMQLLQKKTASYTTGTGSGNVKYSQSFASSTRNKPLQPRLFNAIQQAANTSKVDVVIYSGGQDQYRRTGSNRHNDGWAADVWLYSNGKQLNCRNPDDIPILSEFVRAAKQAGCTGAGMGPGYMGAVGLHIDMSWGNSVPAGSGAVTWGDHKPGGSGRTPVWLRQAFA
jgi:hypothetical protein